MITGTYVLTISGVDVLVNVSTVSATLVQLAAWQALWTRLLSGSAAPGGSPQSSANSGRGEAL